MNIKTKTLVTGALAISLFTGGLGVYAGTIIESYKSPRGHIVTVEKENIHKNRIGITVNGKELNSTTWYANDVSYAPIREVAEMLGASVNYNPKTVSADIVTKSKLLDLLGLKMQVPYNGTIASSAPIQLKITQFNPNTNVFEGVLTRFNENYKIEGKISETEIKFDEIGYLNSSNIVKYPYRYTLKYNPKSNEYTGKLVSLSNNSSYTAAVAISLK